MKTIKNKTTSILKDDTGKAFMCFSDLAIACVNQPTPDGFSAEDIRTRLKLLDVFKNAQDEINLEDADFASCAVLVSKMKWAIIHSDIVDFCDNFK